MCRSANVVHQVLKHLIWVHNDFKVSRDHDDRLGPWSSQLVPTFHFRLSFLNQPSRDVLEGCPDPLTWVLQFLMMWLKQWPIIVTNTVWNVKRFDSFLPVTGNNHVLVEVSVKPCHYTLFRESWFWITRVWTLTQSHRPWQRVPTICCCFHHVLSTSAHVCTRLFLVDPGIWSFCLSYTVP